MQLKTPLNLGQKRDKAQVKPRELLEHPKSSLNHNAEMKKLKRDGLKIREIGQSAAKPRIEEGSSTIENIHPIVEVSRVEGNFEVRGF